MSVPFESLASLLEGHFYESLEELPPATARRLPDQLRTLWNSITAAQRRAAVSPIEVSTDPNVDKELSDFYFVAGFIGEVYRTGTPHHIKQYEAAHAEQVRQHAERDNQLRLSGTIPKGFMRLDAAVRRITGLDEHAVIRIDQPAWLLLGEALQARHDWEVACFCLPDRDAPTGRTTYVHFADFGEWAQPRLSEFRLSPAPEPPSRLQDALTTQREKPAAQPPGFAEANTDRKQNAENDHERWRQEAEKIRQSWSGTKPPSKRRLAKLIRSNLSIEASAETIRKVL